MKSLLPLLLAAPLALATAAILPADEPDLAFDTVEAIPTSMLRLGEAAMIAPAHFLDLGIELGQPAVLESESGSAPVRLFKIQRDPRSISVKASIRQALGVEAGEAAITLRLVDESEAAVERPDIGIDIVHLPGDPARWPGLVLAAPHGDSDTNSGLVARGLAEQHGIPTVIAYRVRMSFLGRWIDGNRPTQREPAELFGIRPDRSWTEEAEEVFHWYRDLVLGANTELRRPPGQPPLSLYIDLHGHGLTVRRPDGSTISRRMSEIMVRGFTADEARWLKSNFDDAFLERFPDGPPPSYWGNLPEDRVYFIEGIAAPFTYSGLGGRVFGQISSEYADRAIHIEMHWSLRNDAESRARTVAALGDFLDRVHERFAAPAVDHALEFVPVPAAEFVMGGALADITSDPLDARRVRVDAFEIARTETTNAQFAAFLDEALAAGAIRVEGTEVVSADGGALLCRLAPGASHAAIYYADGGFHAFPGRERHPVVHVSHFGASAFAQARGGRLPTEAEWELAAAWDPARDDTRHWDEDADPRHRALLPGNYMHSNERESGTIPADASTVPVGSIPGAHSPLGAADMVGNAWEWTADWYGNLPAPEEVVANPTGAPDGTMRTIRGGAWDIEPAVATTRSRLGVAPHATLPTVGFRIARD